jgi:hypothetical protein
MLLVLSKFGTRNWGINGEVDYLYTAMSRARRHLTILVEWPAPIEDITEILNLQGGSQFLLLPDIAEMVEGRTAELIISEISGKDVIIDKDGTVKLKGTNAKVGVIEDRKLKLNGVATMFRKIQNLGKGEYTDVGISYRMVVNLFRLSTEKAIYGNYTKSHDLKIKIRKTADASVMTVNTGTIRFLWPVGMPMVVCRENNIDFVRNLIDSMGDDYISYAKPVTYWMDRVLTWNNTESILVTECKLIPLEASLYGSEYPEGMRMSKADHVRFNTKVARVIINYDAQLHNKLHSIKTRIIHLDSGTQNNVNEVIANCEMQYKANSSGRFPDANVHIALQTIKTLDYCTSLFGDSRKYNYYGLLPNLVLRNYKSYVNIVQPEKEDQYYDTLADEINGMVRDYDKVEGFTINYIKKNDIEKDSVLIIDSIFMTANILTMATAKEILMYVIHIDRKNYEVVGGFGTVNIVPAVQWPMNKNAWNEISNCEGVTVHTLRSEEDDVICYNNVNSGLRRLKVNELSLSEDLYDWITVRPVVYVDATVDINIVYKCNMRMNMHPDTTFEQLMVYLKSLGLTYKITKHELNRNRDFSPDVWLNSARLAYLCYGPSQHNVVKMFLNEIRKLNTGFLPLDALLEQLKPIVIEGVKLGESKLYGLLDELLRSVGIDGLFQLEARYNELKNDTLMQLHWSNWTRWQLHDRRRMKRNTNNRNDMNDSSSDSSDGPGGDLYNDGESSQKSVKYFTLGTAGDVDLLTSTIEPNKHSKIYYNGGVVNKNELAVFKKHVEVCNIPWERDILGDLRTIAQFPNVVRIIKKLQNQVVITENGTACLAYKLLKYIPMNWTVVDLQENVGHRDDNRKIHEFDNTEWSYIMARTMMIEQVKNPVAINKTNGEGVLFYNSGNRIYGTKVMNVLEKSDWKMPIYYAGFDGEARYDLDDKDNRKDIRLYVSKNSPTGVTNAIEKGFNIAVVQYEDDPNYIGYDTEEGLKMLSHRMSQYGALEEWQTDIQIHEVKNSASEIVYDPTGQRCLYKCLRFAIKSLGLTENTLSKELLTTLKKIKGVNATMLIYIGMLLEVNVVIWNKPNEGKLYMKSEELPVVEFFISGTLTYGHVTVVETVYEVVKRKHGRIAKSIKCEEVYDLWTEYMMEMVMKKYLTTNWVINVERKREPLQQLTVMKVKRFDNVSYFNVLPPYKCENIIGVVLTTKGLQLAYVSGESHKYNMLVDGPGELISTNILVIRHVKVISGLDSSEFKSRPELTKFFLNNETADCYPYNDEDVSVLMDGIDEGILIVGEYDNRIHDLKDERYVIHNWKGAVHWVVKNEVVIEKNKINSFDESYNAPVNRRVLRQGKIRYAMEFENGHIARALAELCNGEKYGSSVLAKRPVNEMIAESWSVSETGNKFVSTMRDANYIKLLVNAETGMDCSMYDVVISNNMFFTGMTEQYSTIILGSNGVYFNPDDLLFFRLVIKGGAEIIDLKDKLRQTEPAWLKEMKTRKSMIHNKQKINEVRDAEHIHVIRNQLELIMEDLCQTVSDDRGELPYRLMNRDLFTDNYERVDEKTKMSFYDDELRETYEKQIYQEFMGTNDYINDHEFWMKQDISTDYRIIYPKKGKLNFKFDIKGVEYLKWYSEVKTPERIRPSITKRADNFVSAAGNRMMGFKYLRRRNIPVEDMLYRTAKAWFDPKKLSFLRWDHGENTISFNTEETLLWISECLTPKKTLVELRNAIEAGFTNLRMTDANVHLKMESLYKEEPITDDNEAFPRLVVWQKRLIAAMFTVVFKLVKQRLKWMLGANKLYTDGMTYTELDSWLSQFESVNYFMESDLSKQDRQTDWTQLESEFNIYILLGIDKKIIELWSTMHFHWKFSGKDIWGMREGERHTGGVTTAISNDWTDMVVHTELLEEIGDNLSFCITLGDDNSMGMKGKQYIDERRVVNNIATDHGQESKMHFYQRVINFCGMLVSCITGNTRLYPDYVKLYHKFQLSNGNTDLNGEVRTARAKSYRCMLGMSDSEQNNIKWYDDNDAIMSASIYYGISEGQVELYKEGLLNLMQDHEKFEQEILLNK